MHSPVSPRGAGALACEGAVDEHRSMTTSQQRVLVTGGSGFIATYCILQLLEQGYIVRTTVRSLDREPGVRALLRAGGQEPGDRLGFVEAELTTDDGWEAAVADCDFVLHVASPLPFGSPKDENEVIIPARDGTLRVLRAARNAGVKRVVLTSAFGTIGFGYGRTDHEFTEDDWSIIDGPGVNAYYKSKIVAERAAWDFMAAEDGSMQLASINPVAVLGPVLGENVSGSNHLVKQIVTGELPGYPDFWIPIVDVRDVATAHLLAMVNPDAAGQRFIAYSGTGLTLKQVGATLKKSLGERGSKVPTRSIPNFVIRLGALFNATMREIVPDLGISKKINGDKTRRVLGWTPTTAEQSVIDTGESMFEKGAVKA